MLGLVSDQHLNLAALVSLCLLFFQGSRNIALLFVGLVQ